jgi:hypothetical protein
MRSDVDHNKNSPSASKIKVFGIINFCFLLLLTSPSCRKQISAPERQKLSPPDLNNCSRIEIWYLPSPIESFIPRVMKHDLLSLEEIKSVNSLEPIVMDDPERIKTLAHNVSLGLYDGPAKWAVNMKPFAKFVCYNNDERLNSLTIFWKYILTEDKQWFKYPKDSLNIDTFTPQILKHKIKPFELRVNCGSHMDILWSTIAMTPQQEHIYPESSKWCDVVVRRYPPARKLLKCPSAGEGKCHYAMNPNCGPNSPPDMVLLFETKAGWNQHGGPELFTFDNHDPRGGCVLLNDRTVKFIRTEEELHSLLWKP